MSRWPDRGAALLEVLVALAILALAAGPLVELTRQGLRRSAKADERLHASRALDAVLADVTAGRQPAPAAGELEIERFGIRCRLHRRASPAAGLIQIEAEAGGLRRRLLLEAAPS